MSTGMGGGNRVGTNTDTRNRELGFARIGRCTHGSTHAAHLDPSSVSLLILSSCLVLFAFLSSASVAGAEDCTGLLPDFTCDGRVSRPAGHVSPMSMPYLFEDPYIRTELNLVGIYHNFPADSVFDGGEAGVIALQARVALTDRLAFIATKDGYTFLRPDNSILDDEEGFMDITVGLKYAVIDDRDSGLIVTPSLRYEIPLGNKDVLQGVGKGVVIPAVSIGFGPEDVHFVADFGAQVAVDGDRDSSSIFYNFHIDQAFAVEFIPGADFIVPFIELSGMTWVDSGDGRTGLETDLGRLSVRAAQDILSGVNPVANPTADRRFEGADVANLGSSGMAGEDLITMAWGFWIPFDAGLSTGFSYERVLSQRQDIFEQRFTVMLNYGF